MHPREVYSRKPYELPVLRKLTSEQATLFLMGQAYIGHRGARILLELLFPEPNLQDDLRPNPWD
jgi:hypothetical protein